MNHVSLLGNIGQEIELKQTQGGNSVCELSLAVNESWKDSSGEKKEKTIWVSVTCWGRTAEIASEYLAKGRKVLVEGKLDMDQWDDKETGKKRTKLKVTCTRLHLLPSGDRQQSSQSSGDSDPATKSFYEPPSQDTEDVPF